MFQKIKPKELNTKDKCIAVGRHIYLPTVMFLLRSIEGEKIGIQT